MRFRVSRRVTLWVGIACLATSGFLLAADGYLRVKAAVAGVLIERAWSSYLEDGQPHPPWRWADMHPVAVLEVERFGDHQVVLSGAGGESLAFGIGHVSGTAPPNRPGNCVLAGHRNTSMAWLASAAEGDRLRLVTASASETYRIETTRVVDRSDVSVLEPTRDGSRLILVTCYPFGGVLAGRERYVVTAVRERSP